MVCSRQWTRRRLRYLGRHAHDPRVAAAVVGASAAAFTTVWLLVLSPGEEHVFDRLRGMLSAPVWLGLVVVNATGLTFLLWRRFVAGADRLGYRRAGAVGLGIGLVSYATLGALVAGFWRTAMVVGASPAREAWTATEFLKSTVFTIALAVPYGLLTTVGIPILLSTGAALSLAALDKRYTKTGTSG